MAGGGGLLAEDEGGPRAKVDRSTAMKMKMAARGGVAEGRRGDQRGVRGAVEILGFCIQKFRAR